MVSQLFVIFVEKKTVTKDVVIQVYRLLGVRFPLKKNDKGFSWVRTYVDHRHTPA